MPVLVFHTVLRRRSETLAYPRATQSRKIVLPALRNANTDIHLWTLAIRLHEVEGEDGCLPSDVLLKRGSVSTSVFRKPDPDRCFEFMSHHPQAHKAAVALSTFTVIQPLPLNSSNTKLRIHPSFLM